jgi:ribosomal-protein-alanine N-acetyltransferase
MAFFRTINFTEPLPSISGDGISLRTPQMTDYGDWATLRESSRDFLTPWEPTWPADDLTRSAFRRRIRRYVEDLRTDQGYAFLIFRNSDEALVGGLTLANIRRGVAQAGSLGYWMGLPHVRRGYMTAAVRAVIPFAFATLRLQRAFRPMPARSGSWKTPALRAKAMLASICASTARGRIICCTHASRTARRLNHTGRAALG